MRICKLEECLESFEPKVHNQIFCKPECARIATNARILAEYHAKKNKRKTKRVCKTVTCGTILSIYNDGKYCSIHEYEQRQLLWADE